MITKNKNSCTKIYSLPSYFTQHIVPKSENSLQPPVLPKQNVQSQIILFMFNKKSTQLTKEHRVPYTSLQLQQKPLILYALPPT